MTADGILGTKRRRVRVGMVAGGSMLMSLAACSSFSNVNPLAKTNDFDRVFISAAQTWDLDKDGGVTCDEWKTYVSTSVREADANGDGLLDATEFQNLIKSDRLFEVANIAYYDANSDGRVSADEMIAKPNRAFQLLDRNNDCRIDRTESVQVYSPVQQKDKGGAPDQTIPTGR